MKLFGFFYLFVLPAIICTFVNVNTLSVHASEDEVEDELIDVENEETVVAGGGDYTETEADAEEIKVSPDASTFLLFTKPIYTAGSVLDLPAGRPVDFLIGFLNNGGENFVVESVEASFRYPMDYSYYIQNFTAIPFNREVLPGHEATVSYSFIPSDTFAGRPFGLNIALNYRDNTGYQFVDAVFNETVNIVEIDEGLDGETFFLYIFLAAVIVLLLVIGQQYLVGSVGKRKRAQVARKTIETGTTDSTDVDYDWLPEETLKAIQKSSPKQSPKAGKVSAKQSPKPSSSAANSPRQRKATRVAGSAE